jgi:hypothetical protein
MRRVSRRSLLGARVQDCRGEDLGQVVDTWPADGGWELELVVLRLPRIGVRRMLPIADVLPAGGGLRTIYSRAQVLDAPEVDTGRHDYDAPDRAKAYWRFEEAPHAGSLTPRWRPSSGYSGTARRFPTAPSRTPSES